MLAPLIAVLISGGMVVALVMLFRRERRAGRRCAQDARTLFDQSLEETRERLRRYSAEVTGKTLRQSIHYLFHCMLTVLLHQLQRLENLVNAIARLNKRRAQRPPRQKSDTATHLRTIAAHKQSIQLSEPEKQRRRDEALNGIS